MFIKILQTSVKTKIYRKGRDGQIDIKILQYRIFSNIDRNAVKSNESMIITIITSTFIHLH